MKFYYRPEIDGLRGLAVLPVILFHASFGLFKGGYVGVDVFFVLSGYLITSIILKDLEKKKFNIINFYNRRARRILPALIVVITATLAFSYILPPDDLKNYSKSIISSLTFWSNYQFTFETGYFDTPSQYKPLLHTWSLSIEEQFYIIYPIFFILLFKLNKKIILYLLFFVLFINLLFLQIGGNIKFTYPYINEEFSFNSPSFLSSFMLPLGRVWELALGGVASLLLYRNYKIFIFSRSKYQKIYLNILSFIGIFLIFFSIFYLSEDFQYPSFYTLIPTMGTFMLILFCHKNTFINKILSTKLIVIIGLISYSAYLIHYPVFSYIKYLNINISNFNYIIIIIIILLISYINWKFIETPFRKNKISLKNFLLFLFISYIFLISVSLIIYKNDGLPDRKNFKLNNSIQQSFKLNKEGNNCFAVPYIHEKNIKSFCNIGDIDKKQIDFIVYGDSQIVNFYSLLDKISKKYNKKGIFVGSPSCVPLQEIYLVGRNDQRKNNCNKLNSKIFDIAKEHGVKNIILFSNWTSYFNGGYFKTDFQHLGNKPNQTPNELNSKKIFKTKLMNTLKLYEKTNTNVFIIESAPLHKIIPKLTYYRSFDEDKTNFMNNIIYNSVDISDHLELQSDVREIFDIALKVFNNLKVINFDNIFCNKDLKKCILGNTNHSFYQDENHLSVFGVKLTDQIFEKYMKNF